MNPLNPQRSFLVRATCSFLLILAASNAEGFAQEEKLNPLRARGTQWVDADGEPVLLKGTNLGNWLVQEFWMMDQGGNGVHDQCTLEAEFTRRFGFQEKERLIKLFRDNWIKERDFDQLQKFGFNVVRLPILWSVIEDARQPKTLREDAWHYIDWTIAQAKKRGMYVILDLHGAHGGQTMNDHTGCSGQNQYWTNRGYQERTLWVWQQIAERYKDEPAVAAFDPINEPWGSTAEDMAERVLELYHTIRAIDDKHIIILHGHYSNIKVYGDPADSNLTNVAFQLHPYPGLFGDRPDDSHFDVHRDWLRGGADGTKGVCEMNSRMTQLRTPLLMGEFQPWQSAGIEMGGKLARATYDTYASYGWASTSWTYKVATVDGGQGKGLWGMVTNAASQKPGRGTGLIAKASSWDCAGWDSSFAASCGKDAEPIVVGGTGPKTYYLVIKAGAIGEANLDINYDNVSLKNSATKEELLVNGGFGSGEGWTAIAISGMPEIEFRSIDNDKHPSGGHGESLRVSRPLSASGDVHGAIYQPVTLRGGESYTISGFHKDNGSSNAWSEIYLMAAEPTSGVDVVDHSGRLDFTTATLEEIEALYRSYGEGDYDVHSGLTHWLVTDEPNDIFVHPPRPIDLNLNESKNFVSLRWVSVNGRDIRYNVYRSTRPGGRGECVASGLMQNNFNDPMHGNRQTYFYTATAFNETGESFRSNEAHTSPAYVPVPARIEAEQYTVMSGIQAASCGDTGGGFHLGFFDPNDFVEFNISAQTAGNFSIDYRLASETGSKGFEVLIDDQVVDFQTLEATGGWQNYQTQTGDRFALSPGNHTLRFRSIGKEWNINWFELKQR